MRQIDLNTLTAKEKNAMNVFLKEAHALYRAANTAESFETWIKMLAEGLHDAFIEQNKKGNRT